MDADASSAPPPPPPPKLAHPAAGNNVWSHFQQNFSQVQYLLDHNRLLINEINQNHQSRIPESLTRNVSLTRELNNNITKVVELYAHISESFVKFFENPSDSHGASSNALEGAPVKHPTGSPGNKNSRPALQ